MVWYRGGGVISLSLTSVLLLGHNGVKMEDFFFRLNFRMLQAKRQKHSWLNYVRILFRQTKSLIKLLAGLSFTRGRQTDRHLNR